MIRVLIIHGIISFANIVYNKEQYKDVYESYEHIIELYVYEQLKQERIDEYLVYLYREFIKPQLVKEDTAAFIARLKFMYHITCFDGDVKAIIVKYGELKELLYMSLQERYVYTCVY